MVYLQDCQTLEDLLSEFYSTAAFKKEFLPQSPDFAKKISKEAAHLRAMYLTLQQYPERKGHVRIQLKRIRSNDESSWDYALLAIFPEGFQFFKDEDAPKLPPFIVYMRPQTPCTSHASDLLYRFLRDNNQIVGYIPFLDRFEYEVRIRRGRPFIEFKDRVTGKTENPQDFVNSAICGYFDNEKTLKIPEQLLKSI